MARTALNVIPPKEEEPQQNVVDLGELLSRELGDTTYRCPNYGEAKLLRESEIRGTVGWQRQRSQKPPMARARTEIGGGAKQPAANTIRPPPD